MAVYFYPNQPHQVMDQPIDAVRINGIERITEILNNPASTRYDLGHAFVLAVQKGLREFYPQIFAHRNANDIPLGEEGIGHAVLLAVHLRDFQTLDDIRRHHPAAFQQIPLNEEYGLGQALLSEVEYLSSTYRDSPSLAILQLLLNHPPIRDLEDDVPRLDGILDTEQPEGEYEITQHEGGEMGNLSTHLGILFREVMIVDATPFDTEIMRCLLQSSIDYLFNANGPFGLGRALAHAAYYSDLQYLQSLLLHPRARNILSLETRVNERTQMETDFPNLNCYGITEAIFLTVCSEDHDNQKQGKIEALLNFATANNITLDQGGDFGLLSAIAEAKETTSRDIAEILESWIDD